ncbi:MAG: hypothetical protein ACPGN3_14635 [Opitutales bacterium]
MPSRVLLLFIFTICTLTAVEKPVGIFSSAGSTDPEIYEHESLRGVLIRAPWFRIETAPDVFDFDMIDIQVAAVEAEGLPWSLAVVAGGVGAPDWLMDDGSFQAEFVNFSFRGDPNYRLPLLWDSVVQDRLENLATVLGNRYTSNTKLALVYIPQMTSNGVEGHLQGVNMSTFRTAGYTEQVWVDNSLSISKAFANAFPDKPLAFEVHEIDNDADVPNDIINALWNDPDLDKRVGAAMWWVSGDRAYQSDLLAYLAHFPGDIYGQIIGSSDQTSRFTSDGYAEAFVQARELNIRYLEPWEYELKTGNDGADGANDALLQDFNRWADETFILPELKPQIARVNNTPSILWHARSGRTYTLEHSKDLKTWEIIATQSPSQSGPIEFTDDENASAREAFYRVGLETD